MTQNTENGRWFKENPNAVNRGGGHEARLGLKAKWPIHPSAPDQMGHVPEATVGEDGWLHSCRSLMWTLSDIMDKIKNSNYKDNHGKQLHTDITAPHCKLITS